MRVWDSVVLPAARRLLGRVEFAETLVEAVEDADAALIVTDWPELHELVSPEVQQAMRTPLIVDGRNMLDPAEVQAGGFIYESIGRPSAFASDLDHARGPMTPPSRRNDKPPLCGSWGASADSTADLLSRRVADSRALRWSGGGRLDASSHAVNCESR